MPEETENEKQAVKSEETGSSDASTEPAGPESAEKPEKQKAAKRFRWRPSIRFPVKIRWPKINKRWVGAGVVAGLMLLLVGAGWYSKDHWIAWGKKMEFSKQPSHKVDPDRSMEEKLDPFFVSFKSGEKEGITLIDFSVVWDGLASVRYRKMELQIRDEVYEHLKSLVVKDAELKDQLAFLEEDMSRIFRRNMGVEDLKIKIREIKVY